MTTLDPRRKLGTALGTSADLPPPDLGTNLAAAAQPPQAAQAAQAISPQVQPGQPGQQVEKPKPNALENVGKVLNTIGKIASGDPEAMDMLKRIGIAGAGLVGRALAAPAKGIAANPEAAARIGIAFGTSQSGVQSLGARLGTQVLAGSEARRAQDIAKRQVAVGEERAATLESKLQFDIDTWESFGQLDAANRTESLRIQADASLIRSNAALSQANANELDAMARDIEAKLAAGNVSINNQVKAINIYTAKARAAVVSLGFGKLTINDDGSTTFSITDPSRGNDVYNKVFGDEVKRAIATGYLPAIPIVSYQGEDLSKALTDSLEGLDILRTMLGQGNDGKSVDPPKPVTAGDVNLGDIIAGTDQGVETAKQEAAFQKVQAELESRVEVETIQTFSKARKGSLLSDIGRTTVKPPSGSGTEADPYLIYTGSSKDTKGVHKSEMERLLKTKGAYLRINNLGLYRTTGDPDSPERVAP